MSDPKPTTKTPEAEPSSDEPETKPRPDLSWSNGFVGAEQMPLPRRDGAPRGR